jgi:hypothetical protein
MIVFTEPNDTPERIAHRYLGYPDNSLADRILADNKNTFAWQIMQGCGVYASNRVVWVREEGEFDPILRDDIVHGFDWISSHQRAALAKAQKAGIDICSILNAHAIAAHAQELVSPNALPVLGTFMSQTLLASLDLGKERATSFEKAIYSLRDQLKVIQAAETDAERAAAKAAYKLAFIDVQERFGRYLNHLNKTGYRALQSSRIGLNIVNKRGWEVYRLETVRQIERVAATLRWISNGGLIIDISLGIGRVVNAAENGQNWQKEMVKVEVDILLEIGSIILADAVLTVFGFEAPSIVVILGTGFAATTTTYLLKESILDPIIEEYVR